MSTTITPPPPPTPPPPQNNVTSISSTNSTTIKKASDQQQSLLQLSYRGKVIELSDDVNVNVQTITGIELYTLAKHTLHLSSDDELKLIYKGKRIDSESMEPVFFVGTSSTSKNNKKMIKIMAIATSSTSITNVKNQKSDPTIRGFDNNEHTKKDVTSESIWGTISPKQDPNYKFVKLEVCTWQSFGHRASDEKDTPHAFKARQLLEKLSMDPGIIEIMKTRQLVVNTLGEMDPIDDRIMHKHQSSSGGHSCLLGYNTNHGLRIDLKLRHDNLKTGFRPYNELISTLIHELSHNWVGEHNLLFWSNYADMKIEYLYKHMTLKGTVINGKTTTDIADLPSTLSLDNISNIMKSELLVEMNQHGLHPNMIQNVIDDKINVLQQETLKQQQQQKQRLGGDNSVNSKTTGSTNVTNNNSNNLLRERALAAAERRAAASASSAVHLGSNETQESNNAINSGTSNKKQHDKD